MSKISNQFDKCIFTIISIILYYECILYIYFYSDKDTLDLQSLPNSTVIESRKDIDPKKLTGTYAVR